MEIAIDRDRAVPGVHTLTHHPRTVRMRTRHGSGAGVGLLLATPGAMASSVFSWSEVVERERDGCTSLVDAYGATGVVLSESTLDLRALFVMSRESALATGVLPLRMSEGTLWIASGRPLSPSHVDALAAHARMKVVVVLATSALLRGAIEAAYGAAARGACVLVGLRSTSKGAHLALVRPLTSLANDVERLVTA